MRFAVPPPPGLEDVRSEVGGAAAGMIDFAQMVQYATQSPEQAVPAAPPTTSAGFLWDHMQNEELAQAEQLQHVLLQEHLMQQQACGSSGEWVEAVLSAAPFLDAGGMKAALAILDKAHENIQRAKPLDGIIASTHAAGGIFTSMPHLHAVEQMKAQLLEEQQALLRQLHQLRAFSVTGGSGAAARAAQRPGALRLGPPAGSEGGAPPRPRQQQGHQLGPRAHAKQEEQLLARPPWQQPRPRGPQARLSAVPPEVPQQGAHGPAQTLSSSLQLLAAEDPDCLFVVRRINRLGFQAPRRLKRHFSGCGPVSQVLLAHSTLHESGEQTLCPRRRPSSLGFVHMATPEGARRALALGGEQVVDGCVIVVQRFERQQKDDSEEDEDDHEEQDQEHDPGASERAAGMEGGWTPRHIGLSAQSFRAGKNDSWTRQQGALSTRSTASRSAEGSGSRSASEDGPASTGGSSREEAAGGEGSV